MQAETIVFICISAVLLGVVIWMVAKKWSSMSKESKDELIEKGKDLIIFAADAVKNDGKIDKQEMCAIMKKMIDILSYLSGKSVTALMIQTGTEELLVEKTE